MQMSQGLSAKQQQLPQPLPTFFFLQIRWSMKIWISSGLNEPNGKQRLIKTNDLSVCVANFIINNHRIVFEG